MTTAAVQKRATATQWIESSSDSDLLDFGEAVRKGLGSASKTLPSHFFYDAEGSRLFETICTLPEYYLTRAETEILEVAASALAARLPWIRTIVELGSGTAVKTEWLLRAFGATRLVLHYAPIDVSRTALEESIERLELDHPTLELRPTVGEYEAGLDALEPLDLGPNLMLWLGSSIGNLTKSAAAHFLSQLRDRMTDRDRLLVGIDLRKDRSVLEQAYDDRKGVTARFNLNLFDRINRELGGEFDLDQFRHRVHYDEPSGSVQSFLESRSAQRVAIRDLDLEAEFAQGERVHTEDSHKYDLEEIDALAGRAGLALERRDFDAERRFSLNLFARRT